jgi:DNA-directed RNA polymerase subunit M/transcription elongation factor TFIIS
MTNRKKFVSLRCPICNANISVSKEQIGKILVCPDCETKVRVPESIAEKINRAEKEWERINQLHDKQNSNSNSNSNFSSSSNSDSILNNQQFNRRSNEDVYAISGDGKSQAENKTIRIYCKLCGTMMYASESQIGEELTCPDCETKTVVTVPRKSVSISSSSIPPPPPEIFEGGKVFGLADSKTRTGTGFLVPVVCSLCGTRMYADESEIGGFKICPDCGRQNEIKSVPKSEKIQPDLIRGGAYGVDQSIEKEKRPVIRTLTDYRYVDNSTDKEIHNDIQNPRSKKASAVSSAGSRSRAGLVNSDEDEKVLQRLGSKVSNRIIEQYLNAGKVPQLPKYPFWTRVFVPFMDSAVWSRIMISSGFMVMGVLVGSFFVGLLVILSAPFGMVVGMIGLFFAGDTFYTLFYLAMVGNDSPSREDWNLFRLFDSGLVVFWLLSLVIVSFLPGYGLYLYLSSEMMREATSNLWGIDDFLFSVLLGLSSEIFLFPIFFLSCIETNSSFMIFGGVTCSSLFRCIFVWARFYFISVLFLFFLFFLMYLVNSLVQDIFADVIISIPLCVIFAMLYARYLGRLSWILEEFAKTIPKK